MKLSIKKGLAALLGTAMFLACAAAGAEAKQYEGVAVGLSVMNQYPLGDWGDYAKTNIGGGLAAEYTLPHFLPLSIDLGASFRFEFAHTLPKSDTTLKSHNEIRAAAGLFFRIPFAIGGCTLALQPEVAVGASLNNTEGQNGAKASGWYTDTLIMVAPSVRFVPPAEALSHIEFEIAPLWTMSLEDSNTVNNIGFRLGGVWHFE